VTWTSINCTTLDKLTADGDGVVSVSPSVKDSAMNDLLSADPQSIRLDALSTFDQSHWLLASISRKMTANSPHSADRDKEMSTQFLDQLLATGSWKL
jgi:hypothetical protein